jgi:hypothetical protein
VLRYSIHGLQAAALYINECHILGAPQRHMLKSNMLYHVNDAKGFQNANDLDDQGLVYSIPLGQTNYKYDPTGNLISDAKE